MANTPHDLSDILVSTRLLEIDKEYLQKSIRTLSEKNIQLDQQINSLSAKIDDLMRKKNADPDYQWKIDSRMRDLNSKVYELVEQSRRLTVQAEETIETSIELDMEIAEKKEKLQLAIIRVLDEDSEPQKPSTSEL